MKSIKQIADELNTTPQNIYTYLKRNNISRDSLKPKKQGKSVLYDDDAERIIKELIQRPVKQENGNNENNEMFEALNAENKSLNIENKRLNDELLEAKEEIARLRQIEEELRHQVSSLIDTNKGLMILQTQRLVAPENKRTGLFERFRLLLKKENK